ncbi:uncharacterized protein LOC115211630 [Octopus sinensis]|uniref:Uncharacterized protein LOC115211630 n=1 Tax=Octopus sinensis TaxID=2607531 RepID=A0A7E6ETZ9_9MOLL|nr:uncharacterized protein LOC115211630 [Octopus sinensis]XP_036358813.1 uncharacterized protein LOC115211630 [Octopus sinensis]
MGATELFVIELADNQECYYSGTTLSGEVKIDLAYPLDVSGITLTFKGYGKAKWTSSDSNNDDIVYASSSTYMDERITLYGTPDQLELHRMDSGEYRYPFTYNIPPLVPSSCSGDRGKVKYKLIAVIQRFWKSFIEKEKVVKIFRPLDLNAEPGPSLEIKVQDIMDASCCCLSDGNIFAKLSVKKNRFAIGEVIDFDIELLNRSNRNISSGTLRLQQIVVFSARRTDGADPDSYDFTKVKKEKNYIDIHKTGKVRPYEQYKATDKVRIPPVATSHLEGCEFINVIYRVQFLPEHVGCCSEPLEHDVVIGTIPYAGVSVPQSEVNAAHDALQDAATNLPPPPSQSVVSIQPGRLPPPPPGFIIDLPSEDPPSYTECLLQDLAAARASASQNIQKEKMELGTVPSEKPPISSYTPSFPTDDELTGLMNHSSRTTTITTTNTTSITINNNLTTVHSGFNNMV